MIGRDYTPCEVTPVEFADILRANRKRRTIPLVIPLISNALRRTRICGGN
jgi:hypothetical protein